METHTPTTLAHFASTFAEALSSVTYAGNALEWTPVLAVSGDVAFRSVLVVEKKNGEPVSQRNEKTFTVTVHDYQTGRTNRGTVHCCEILEIPAMEAVQSRNVRIDFEVPVDADVLDLAFKIRHAVAAAWTGV